MKEGVVLAGGLGTRLNSVVNDRPKCMALINSKPFLEYLLNYLAKEQFDHIVLALGYKAENVLEWLSRVNYPFRISYVVEDVPLGTGGAIALATKNIQSDSFFVFNGDTLFLVNTDEMRNNLTTDILLALKPMTNFDRYGSVEIDSNNIIAKFNEKKHCEYGLINGGVYLLKRSLFDNFLFPKEFSFEKNILESNNIKIKIGGILSNSYFIDIGIPSDYDKANYDFLKFNDNKKQNI